MDVPHPNNPVNRLPKSDYKAPKYDPDFKQPLEPSFIPDGHPSDIIIRYAGTFSTLVTPTSTVRKTVSIELKKELLCFQHLPDVEVNKSVIESQDKTKGKARVNAKGKVTKPTAPKRTTKTAAAKLAEVEETAPISALAAVIATKATAPKRATKISAAATAVKKETEEAEETVPALTLAAAMATKDSSPKPAIAKAAPLPAFLAHMIRSGAAGLGGDIVARAPSTAFDRAKTYLLHLADNGVQQVRVSGATAEETEKNK